MLHKSQLASFSTIGRNQPDLGFALAVLLLLLLVFADRFTFTFGNEGQPTPIRGPARIRSFANTGCEASRFAAFTRNHPDGSTIFVLMLVDCGDGKGDALPIR